MGEYHSTEINVFSTEKGSSRISLSFKLFPVYTVRWPTTVTAKELTSRQKEKPHGKKKNLTTKRKRLTAKTISSRQKVRLTAKRKRLAAKRKPRDKTKKTRGKISSMLRGHFNSYFFCCEVEVIIFAVILFFLPRVFFFLP